MIAGGLRSGGRERPRTARSGASGVVPRGMRLVPATGRGVSHVRRSERWHGSSRSTRRCSFPELERGILEFWRDGRRLRAFAGPARGRAPLGLLRGPAHGQRHARGAPRGVADVQGRLPAVQDDDRPLRGPQGRLGLPRPARRARGREGDRHHRETRHRGVRGGGVQPAVPRVGHALRRRLGAALRADRHVDRPRRRVLDDGHGVHRVGLVVAEDAARPRRCSQESDKVTAYCPRCGTALSDAEVAMGYETVEDPSVFVRLPLVEVPSDASLVGASLVVWTTTPWTLPSNEGAAVAPQAAYDGGRTRRRASGGRRGAARARAGRRRIDRGARVTGDRSGRGALRAAVPQRRGRPLAWSRATSSRWRTAPASSTWRPRSARRTSRSAARRGGRSSSPSTTPDGSRTQAPAFVRGRFVKDADPDDRRGPARAGRAVRAQTRSSTPIRSAGGARRRSSTTPGPPGTCAPPR